MNITPTRRPLLAGPSTNPADGWSRREFTAAVLRASAGMLAASPLLRASAAGPAILDGARSQVTHGVSSGDVSFDSAIIWGRASRESRMVVEWSTSESFKDVRRVTGPAATEKSDFTAKTELTHLPGGQRIFYRVHFDDGGGRSAGEPVAGQFVTAARDTRDVMFAWSGDTCGQGYGIDEARGGLLTYESMRQVNPDFFVHSGDTVYADGPFAAEMKLPDGSLWRNLVTEEKSKVAETLAEFRGNQRYTLLDSRAREFNASTALFAQWDDHEVRNNWYPGQRLDDGRYHDTRYKDPRVDLLWPRARQAFLEYWPVRPNWRGRIFRSIRRGPLCELFILDQRTYRGPNNPNRQARKSRETAYMGDAQIAWLKTALAASKATWKIICSDMPVGLVVSDGKADFENCANGDGPPLGRELEIASLLRFMKEKRVRNTIWITADVHYAASYHYDPSRAVFTGFDPFWEFISGPLHAASLGSNRLDNTFGPAARWVALGDGAKASGPYSDLQFFSTVRINGKTRAATVTHFNRVGKKLW
ncbi:MAG TPA: alkaline phosphatase D family protein, partial [Verrucomicrobiae bacterium]|nr:alkaline phosphatase D family protein [Verrucomicrobiae bacterium]